MNYPLITIVHLTLTHRCNLGCKYCFVNQEPKDMTWEVAKASIDFLAKNSKESGHKPQICFFGGEPLLMWDELIVKSCEYIGEKYKDYGFHLTITTNGTLLTDDKIKYMLSHKIGLLTSIDGDSCTQNYNRPFLGGHESSKVVEKNIKNALSYGMSPTFRATIVPATCHNAYHDYLYAISLGYKSIFAITNSFEFWDLNHEKILEEQYNKIAEHYIHEWRAKKKQPIELSLLNKLMLQCYKDDEWSRQNSSPNKQRSSSVYRCGVGQGVSAAISPTGGIYGCQELTSNEDESSIFYLGNIYSGVINERRAALAEMCTSSQILSVSDDCETCDAKTFCNGGCTANNYLITGSFNKVPHGCCFFYQLLYRVSRKIINELRDEPTFVEKLRSLKKENTQDDRALKVFRDIDKRIRFGFSCQLCQLCDS